MTFTFTTKQLSNILQMKIKATSRTLAALGIKKTLINSRAVYTLPVNHKLLLSLTLIVNANITKPIYSISELAKLWKWHKKNYTTKRIRQLLVIHSIPIQNKQFKGYVYLVDLQKLLK